MKNIKGVFKKEFDKVFKFPRAIFSTLILPGLIIFIIYFFIGQAAKGQIQDIAEHRSQIYVVNEPTSFLNIRQALTGDNDMLCDFYQSSLENLADLQNQVKEGDIDALIVFDADFDQKTDNNEKPMVHLYYNSTKNNSSVANNKLLTIIEMEKSYYLQKNNIDPNIFTVENSELYNEEEAGGTILAMILPMLIVTLIFANAMGIGSDAVAGEKERGTLATLLMLPIPRTQIIIGKIISTTFMTILSALSSFIGVLAALPFLKELYALEGGVVYGAGDYLAILGILVVMATFASCLLLTTSTYAKSVKEATAYAMPIYLIAMILPMMNMFNSDKEATTTSYLIPIYNFSIILKDILSFKFELHEYLLGISSTLVFIVLLVMLLVRMFRNEKVLFAK